MSVGKDWGRGHPTVSPLPSQEPAPVTSQEKPGRGMGQGIEKREFQRM